MEEYIYFKFILKLIVNAGKCILNTINSVNSANFQTDRYLLIYNILGANGINVRDRCNLSYKLLCETAK